MHREGVFAVSEAALGLDTARTSAFFRMPAEEARDIWSDDAALLSGVDEAKAALSISQDCFSLPGSAESGEAGAVLQAKESYSGLTQASSDANTGEVPPAFTRERRDVGAVRPEPSRPPSEVREPAAPAAPVGTEEAIRQIVQKITASVPAPPPQDLTARNVYVSGLPGGYRSHQFRKMCQRFGPIEASKLCGEGGGAGSKAFGFALFFHKEHAAACVQGLNGCVLEGCVLQVRFADASATPKPLQSGAATAKPSVAAPPPQPLAGPRPQPFQARTLPVAPPPAAVLAGALPPPPCPPTYAMPGTAGGAAVPAMYADCCRGVVMMTPPPPPPSPAPAVLSAQNLAQHNLCMQQAAQQQSQSQMFGMIAAVQKRRAEQRECAVVPCGVPQQGGVAPPPLGIAARAVVLQTPSGPQTFLVVEPGMLQPNLAVYAAPQAVPLS